jgi:Flp pilus assembly protein TadD
LVFDAALQRWPDEPEAWAGRAAAELHGGDLLNAARDYSTSLRIDGSNSEARHDLAMALLYLGCTHKAQSQIDKIMVGALSSAERAVVENSRDRIAARSQNLVAQEPAACAEFKY